MCVLNVWWTPILRVPHCNFRCFFLSFSSSLLFLPVMHSIPYRQSRTFTLSIEKGFHQSSLFFHFSSDLVLAVLSLGICDYSSMTEKWNYIKYLYINYIIIENLVVYFHGQHLKLMSGSWACGHSEQHHYSMLWRQWLQSVSTVLTIHLCSLDSAPHLDSIQLSTLAQLVAGGYPYDSRDYYSCCCCVLGM